MHIHAGRTEVYVEAHVPYERRMCIYMWGLSSEATELLLLDRGASATYGPSTWGRRVNSTHPVSWKPIELVRWVETTPKQQTSTGEPTRKTEAGGHKSPIDMLAAHTWQDDDLIRRATACQITSKMHANASSQAFRNKQSNEVLVTVRA